MDDHEIIIEIQQGNISVFYRLIDKYKNKALQIAYANVGNWADADEIVQEVFINVYNAIKRFKAKSSFYTWFYRILINKCNDYLRKRVLRKRFFVMPAEATDENGKNFDIRENYHSAVKDGREALINKELGKQIIHAVETLPRRQKLIFLLKNIHGFKISEIAGIMGIFEGTVKAQLFQAVNKLKILLKESV